MSGYSASLAGRADFQDLMDQSTNVSSTTLDVVNFISMYNQHYGRNHPEFYEDSFDNVIVKVKKELKFLLVYIHIITDPKINHWLRETLGNKEVIKFINDPKNNIIFWGCDSLSNEGIRVTQYFKPVDHPFFGMASIEGNEFRIVDTITGFLKPKGMLVSLKTTVADCKRILEDDRMKKRLKRIPESAALDPPPKRSNNPQPKSKQVDSTKPKPVNGKTLSKLYSSHIQFTSSCDNRIVAVNFDKMIMDFDFVTQRLDKRSDGDYKIDIYFSIVESKFEDGTPKDDDKKKSCSFYDSFCYSVAKNNPQPVRNRFIDLFESTVDSLFKNYTDEVYDVDLSFSVYFIKKET